MSVVAVVTAMAQVTTAALSGKVTDDLNELVAGATIQVTHQPTGSVTGTITNVNGRYSITGLQPGGPYSVKVSFVGYQSVIFEGLFLPLGETLTQDAWIQPSANVLEDVVVTGSSNSSMRVDRSGAGTRLSAGNIAEIPTVSHNMNDVMKMTPQGGNTGNGFAVGGGNYRQSFFTVDGAAFNNAFGIGSNLPANGTPISLDALEQLNVNITPYDVRQSGFIGGAINAVTKSGTNDFKASAYVYQTNVHLQGNKVKGSKWDRTPSYHTTYGVSVGGPIIKNKLFFFVNGEFEPKNATGKGGTNASARNSDSEAYGGNVHRPTTAFLDGVSNYLKTQYGYDPGAYQGYSSKVPTYRMLGRLDWNINENNKLNLRFSTTHAKEYNQVSSSTSPLNAGQIYTGGGRNSGRQSVYSMYFQNSQYYQETNFTSWASEWNAKWGDVHNTLRATYSHQDEPRSYDGSAFPMVDILDADISEDGLTRDLVSFGVDPFTQGNCRDVKTVQVTDEVTWSLGNHNFLAGLSFESNDATNGFSQCALGYYVFNSWADFTNNNLPVFYALTYPSDGSNKQFQAEMTYQQYSAYIQDQMNLSDNFKLTAGLRFESSYYPDLEDNNNAAFAAMTWRNGKQYTTDQVPDMKLTVSPRIGFNWDITGDRKYVLRGGAGYFTGRLPYVWLVSAVGNSNCGQIFYSQANGPVPHFHPNWVDQRNEVGMPIASATNQPAAPTGATIIDKDLKLPAAIKASLAFDAKLPGGIDASIEAIYNHEINPAIVDDENIEETGTTVDLGHNDIRKQYKQVNPKYSVYHIKNAGGSAYYYSLTASLAKKFEFGLDLNASYTYSMSKAYSDGVGDQVSGAYYNNRYSKNGFNDHEVGYGTFVAPNRIIASASYTKNHGRNFASHVSLVYEGLNMGYISTYGSTRYSYTLNSNVTGDNSNNYNLMFIPKSRAELDNWNFVDNGTVTDANGNTVTYTADMQRDDFWKFINQDKYLKNRKGKYAERGGAIMPFHSQFDFKFAEDFFFKQPNGKKHTLTLGIDIKNAANLLNKEWGNYKMINSTTPISFKDGNYTFTKVGANRLTKSTSTYAGNVSTYQILFSARYKFD